MCLGQSVLVDKCVDGKSGVVKVVISSVFDKSGILQVLSTEILGAAPATINEKEMVHALRDAKVEGKLPTIIFEIERGQSIEQNTCIETCVACASSLQCALIALLFSPRPMRSLCSGKTAIVRRSSWCPS